MQSIIKNYGPKLPALFLALLSVLVLLDPSTANAQLVECQSDCGWEELVIMFNNIIEWLIIIATSVAALLFMYAGFLYLTSRGDESQVKQATTIFTNVAVGFAIMLIAWLLVTTIVWLLTGGEWVSENEELLPIEL